MSIAHLGDVQEAVGKLVRDGQIDRKLSDKWHFYRIPNNGLPDAKTIIVVAVPQSIVHLSFGFKNREYSAEAVPGRFPLADEARVENILREFATEKGHIIIRARLPLKTLAVRSGLAKYGKNNLAYVQGMGSLNRLIAFYSNAPCEIDNWREVTAMPSCKDCSLCLEKCACGSIISERFLIHAEKCLSNLQDNEPDVPYWVKYQLEWPNALMGCMLCQSVCPVNQPYLKKIQNGPSFSGDETGLILNKVPLDELPVETRQKLEDIRGIYHTLPSNLAALIEKQER